MFKPDFSKESHRRMPCFLFDGDAVLLCQPQGGPCRLPTCAEAEAIVPEGVQLYGLATLDGKDVCAAECRVAVPQGGAWRWASLRQSYLLLPPADYAAAVRCRELTHWYGHSRFCPACGAPAVLEREVMRRCTRCGFEQYPTLSPAVIVLVRRGHEALLVHPKSFTKPYKGLVAGFVEAGESLEEAVDRELYEETGLRVCDVRYFGSQSWPFPHSLMVGFTARYMRGEIKLRDGELETAAWFDTGHLPAVPEYPSLARRLIDWWIKEERP